MKKFFIVCGVAFMLMGCQTTSHNKKQTFMTVEKVRLQGVLQGNTCDGKHGPGSTKVPNDASGDWFLRCSTQQQQLLEMLARRCFDASVGLASVQKNSIEKDCDYYLDSADPDNLQKLKNAFVYVCRGERPESERSRYKKVCDDLKYQRKLDDLVIQAEDGKTIVKMQARNELDNTRKNRMPEQNQGAPQAPMAQPPVVPIERMVSLTPEQQLSLMPDLEQGKEIIAIQTSWFVFDTYGKLRPTGPIPSLLNNQIQADDSARIGFLAKDGGEAEIRQAQFTLVSREFGDHAMDPAFTLYNEEWETVLPDVGVGDVVILFKRDPVE